MVAEVQPGSSADKAGLKPSDVILQIDDYPAYTLEAVAQYVKDNSKPTYTLQVEREGHTISLPFSPSGARVHDVLTGSPASNAGLQSGDVITAVDGKPMPDGVAISEYIRAHGEKPLVFTVQNDAGVRKVTITPLVPVGETVPRIGLEWEDEFGITEDAYGKFQVLHPDPIEQVRSGMMSIFNTVGAIASRKSDVKLQHMGGPVMMMRVYYMFFQSREGWRLALWFSVVLNVNLALLNLLPIPVLDGGHITLAIVEAIRRRPVNVRFLEVVQTSCAVVIIGFMLYIAFFDVQDLFSPKGDQMRFAPKGRHARSIPAMKYCASPYVHARRPTREVMVGSVGIGGANPIRLQSMLTCDTMDTDACVRQTLALVAVGCEIVRITAPTVKDSANLQQIVRRLRELECEVPIVADIHFKPDAALEAARWVEKVRINPGNYADSKKFKIIEYTDEQYLAELSRIRERFTPLVALCKERGVAMRIGTNHGSLSDRIMNRYGDTPLGMVESALEFARIAREMDYHAFIFSMKASNPKVMINAYRLLAARLNELGPDWNYPIHLGVTEAGDGEDGRIKSAIGIGSLLHDGIGDTIRVSLTEDSVHEIPVARALAASFQCERGLDWRHSFRRSAVVRSFFLCSPRFAEPLTAFGRRTGRSGLFRRRGTHPGRHPPRSVREGCAQGEPHGRLQARVHRGGCRCAGNRSAG